jgi:hypothetical protein
VAQKDRGVAPPIRVPWLSRLATNLHAGQDKASYNEQQKGSMDNAMLLGNIEMVNDHTGQVLVGWVRQLTRGMPSLVPVPRKMSSDCSRWSSSDVKEPETVPPPEDARATPL